MVLFIGVSTAWLISTCNFPGRDFFEWFLILPLSIPTYILTYTYVGIFNCTGFFYKFKNFLFFNFDMYNIDIMNLHTIIFLLSFVLYPYTYVMVKSSFINQSQLLLESGRILGNNSIRTFFKVALPIARPSIIGGVILSLMELLNDYGSFKYFGIITFTTGIFRSWFSLGDCSSAIYLSSFLMFFIFFLILLEKFQRGYAKYTIIFNSRSILRYNLSFFQKILAVLFCFLPVFIGFILPFFQLFCWSLDTIHKVINNNFFDLIFTSFLLSFFSSFICNIISIFLLYSIRISPIFFIKSIIKTVILGYSIPGAIIAVGIMKFIFEFNKFLDFMFSFNIMFNSFFILIFSYVVRFIAISYNSINSGFKKISININEVSRSLGINFFKTLFFIEIPLIKHSIIGGFILVFIDILKELPLTLILRPFNFETLSTKTFNLVSNEMIAESSSYALIIIIISLFFIFFLNSLTKNSKSCENTKD